MSQSLPGAQTLLGIINQQILKKERKEIFNIFIENEIVRANNFEYETFMTLRS